VHALIHLPADVHLHGHLDTFSSFPFENYLGQLKRLVRKPSFVLSQIIKRLHERDSFSLHPPAATNDNKKPAPNRQHNLGPIPQNGVHRFQYNQYFEINWKNVLVSRRTGDNCFKINDRIAVVQNILQYADEIRIAYKWFSYQESLFQYPVDSQHIGIHKVSHISHDLQLCTLHDIQGKYVLLPYQSVYAAVPLLHTCTS